MNIEVSRVVLKIGELSIDLTVEQAKELRDVLDRAFPKAAAYYPSWYCNGGITIQTNPLAQITVPQTTAPDDYRPRIWCGQTVGGTLELTAKGCG